MGKENELFEEQEDGKQSIPVAVAVLKAKVDLLTYFVKNVLVTKHEFEHVKMIAYGIITALVAILAALMVYFLKQH